MHINERNPVQENIDLCAVVVLATMLAEMALQLRGSVSLYAILLFGFVCMVTLRGIFFQRGWLLLVFTAGAFWVSAHYTGQGFSVVRSDLITIYQGVVIAGFVSLSHFSDRRRWSFWLRLHRAFMLLGGIAGYLGLVKLMLYNRGIYLGLFFDDLGTYPPGSSLNGDYNLFSLALFLSMGSAAWLLKRDRNPVWYVTSHLSMPGMVAAVLFTSSRRALAFLIIALLLVLWNRFRRGKGTKVMDRQRADQRGRLLIVLGYCAVALMAVANHAQLTESVSNFFSEHEVQSVTNRARSLGSAEATESRLVYWMAAIQRIQESNVLEIAIGSGFSYVRDISVSNDVAEDYPHNFILSAMLYGGVFQTLLTVGLLWRAFWRSWRAGSDFRVLVFWLFLLTLFHFTSSNSIFSTEIFLVLIALALDTAPAAAPADPARGGRRLPLPVRLSHHPLRA